MKFLQNPMSFLVTILSFDTYKSLLFGFCYLNTSNTTIINPIQFNQKTKDLSLLTNLLYIINFKLSNLMLKSSFIDIFWLRSYLIWNDGFLFDFAQKKTADLWVRKFVILTGFLFSDRYLFDSLVRIYNDNFINQLQNFSTVEVENVNSMLGNVLFTLTTMFLLSSFILLLVI